MQLNRKLSMPQLKLASYTVLLAALYYLGGCAPMPQGYVDQASKDQFFDYHRKQAQNRIDAGHYHQALTHIDILITSAPYNSNYKSNKQDLEKLIRHTKSKLVKEIELTRNQGNTEKEYKLLLQALSLTPDDKSINQRLQTFFTQQLREEQARKQEKYAGFRKKDKKGTKKQSTSKTEKASGTDPLAQYRAYYQKKDYKGLLNLVKVSKPVEVPLELEQWLMESHLAVAVQYQRMKKLEAALTHAEKAAEYNTGSAKPNEKVLQMRKELAAALLEKGKVMVRKDIDKAIHMLELASLHDSQSPMIKKELRKAHRIKENLDKIKSLN